LFY
jgi:ATP-dependent RNA helicase DHX8/PRP22